VTFATIWKGVGSAEGWTLCTNIVTRLGIGGAMV
jgi:hypothetical protein